MGEEGAITDSNKTSRVASWLGPAGRTFPVRYLTSCLNRRLKHSLHKQQGQQLKGESLSVMLRIAKTTISCDSKIESAKREKVVYTRGSSLTRKRRNFSIKGCFSVICQSAFPRISISCPFSLLSRISHPDVASSPNNKSWCSLTLNLCGPNMINYIVAQIRYHQHPRRVTFYSSPFTFVHKPMSWELNLGRKT